MISFRLAKESDIWILYQWRNDLITRSMSINQNKISRSNHEEWFKKILVHTESSVYMYGDEKKKSNLFGNVRVDLTTKGISFLSWTINPKFREKGYGKKMLKDFVRINKRHYHAKIRVDNLASMKLCSYAGFKKYYTRKGVTFWKNY